jgi:hypothetical protein
VLSGRAGLDAVALDLARPIEGPLVLLQLCIGLLERRKGIAEGYIEFDVEAPN